MSQVVFKDNRYEQNFAGAFMGVVNVRGADRIKMDGD